MKLDEDPEAKQISRVWSIKVRPMARGCFSCVNKYDVLISRAEDINSRVISESSLIQNISFGD